MEIQQKELMKIIKHYRIQDKVSFIGFHAVDPDTTWYFFRAKNDVFYILEASDYVVWVCGNGEPPKYLQADYYEDFSYSFKVKRWLTSHNGLDKTDESGDYEGYLYWASNSDRCVMAKIKGKFSDYKIMNLISKIPPHSELELAIFGKRQISCELVSGVPRPTDQNINILTKKIQKLIQKEVLELAQKIINTDQKNLSEEDLSKCNYDLFKYVQIWSENDGGKFEENIFIELNNQSWLALCEKRDFPSLFEERNALVFLFKRYWHLIKKIPGPKFLPRKVLYSLLQKFELRSSGELSFKTMKGYAEDCKIYLFEDELECNFYLICRNIEQTNIDQEKTLLQQDFNINIAQFYHLKNDRKKYYYICNASEIVVDPNPNNVDIDEKYYFSVAREEF